MFLARVTGTVVASQKEPSMDGSRFMVLERLDEMMQPKGDYVVAVDAVGAGEGEIVLYAAGSSARQTQVTKDRPADAVIMAIVDSCTVRGKTVFAR